VNSQESFVTSPRAVARPDPNTRLSYYSSINSDQMTKLARAHMASMSQVEAATAVGSELPCRNMRSFL
jgi:hypothetical protein